jgi:tRNA-dihydrouridine synthase
MRIDPYTFNNTPLILAPMAGVTDRPFQQLHRRLSADLAVTAASKRREVQDILLLHLQNLYDFYGEYSGMRIARKHLSWYSKDQLRGTGFRVLVNRVETVREQLTLIRDFFDPVNDQEPLAA